MNYDAFATTFSNSRKDHPWLELDTIIEHMRQQNALSILDIGCGNGRFLAEAENWELRIENYIGIDSSCWMIEEARRLHPEYHFEVIPMESLTYDLWTMSYDAILFLASFHHLDTEEKRVGTLTHIKKLLAPHGRIYLTNWNLRDQERYKNSETSDGEYQIKIWAYSRYYHGFTLDELTNLYFKAWYTRVEHRIFEGGRNIFSIIESSWNE